MAASSNTTSTRKRKVPTTVKTRTVGSAVVITIPKKLRKIFHARPGTRLQLDAAADCLRVTFARARVKPAA